MIKKSSDFIIYNGRAVDASATTAGNGAGAVPLSAGLWQKEALETAGMFGRNSGTFSPVGEQLTLFPMEPVSGPTAAGAVGGVRAEGEPGLPHWDNFKFFAKDSQRQVAIPAPQYRPQTAGAGHAADAHSATNGELIKDGVTELKEDHFPGRVSYTGGGLYPGGSKDDPKVAEQHRDAPNYRTTDHNKRIHGVGQPTKKGFQDVLTHLGAKDKPVVWTNNRAEAVIYINGQPHNLREMASRENLVLKEGASGEEIEALEDQLKQRLIARGSISISKEIPGQRDPVRETVQLTADNVQTTKDVIEELRQPPHNYQIEYKRIPLLDEKSPTPAQMDEMRNWMNEAQKKHPDQNLDFVYNCHQGRGRTTTGMVTAGITQEGKTFQMELPFVGQIGEGSKSRTDRIINDTQHMQNLRETVDEMKGKAGKAGSDADRFREQAAAEQDLQKQKELQEKAAQAQMEKEKYDGRAQDFTKRYAMLQKYSEYVDKYGSGATTPSFDEWMGQSAQVADLDKKWASLNTQLGLPALPGMPMAPGRDANVAFA